VDLREVIFLTSVSIFSWLRLSKKPSWICILFYSIFIFLCWMLWLDDRLSDLVVRVPDYRSRGPCSILGRKQVHSPLRTTSRMLVTPCGLLSALLWTARVITRRTTWWLWTVTSKHVLISKRCYPETFRERLMLKGKSTVDLCLTNEALRYEDMRGSGCIDPCFLDLDTVGSQWWASRPGCFATVMRGPVTGCIWGWVTLQQDWTTWRRENYGPYRVSNYNP
jgi:hypothetical protein